MSDVPQRPRIRPATSDDWQKDRNDHAGPTRSPGNAAGPEPADFDSSTYYEYLERHTGEQSVSKSRPNNVFAPAGASPFGEHAHSSSGQTIDTGPQGSGPQASSSGVPPYPTQPPPAHSPHTSGQFPATQQAAGSKRRNGLKITAIVVSMTLILALVAFFGIRWLAPSSGAVPVDVGGGEAGEPASPSPSEGSASPTASPEEQLNAFTKESSEDASDLEGQWVTQVSAKNVGLKTDGKTWTAQDILDEFEANKIKYPGSILIQSGDWDSYKNDSYWVTVIDTGYSDPEPALDQCRSWGLDRDHCLAKRLVKDGSSKDNSAYLDN